MFLDVVSVARDNPDDVGFFFNFGAPILFSLFGNQKLEEGMLLDLQQGTQLRIIEVVHNTKSVHFDLLFSWIKGDVTTNYLRVEVQTSHNEDTVFQLT
jgi:hypothetical protein